MKNPDRDPNRDRDPNPPQPSERIMQIVHEKDRLKGQLAIKNEEIENLKENFQKSANGLTDEANSLRRNLEQAQAAHNVRNIRFSFFFEFF